MKRSLYQSVAAKAVAYFLCVLLALTALFGVAAAAYLSEDGYYTGERTTYPESHAFLYLSSDFAESAFMLYHYGTLNPEAGFSTDNVARKLETDRTNYRYAIYDKKTGARLFGNTDALPAMLPDLWSLYARTIYGVGENEPGGDRNYVVLGTLAEGLPVEDDFSVQARAFDSLVRGRYALIAGTALCLLLSVAAFIFLLCAAGRHAEGADPECRGLDRVPFDLYLLLAGGLVVFLCYAFSQIATSFRLLTIAGLSLPLIALVLVILVATGMSFAARIRCKNLIKNTVIATVLRLVWRFIKWACRGIRTFVVNLPVFWRTGLGFAAYLFINMILVLTRSGFAVLLCVLFNLFALIFVCFAALQMRRLQAGADALASGDFSHPVGQDGFLPTLKKLAASMDSIAAGMARAIEARMKSERMKTDLITNVSHDLKTPLTSIINYVDLLKKEELPGERAKEYVEVLDRQSQRLKKLAEDVVEASKASSGAINANLQPTDVAELLRQSAGEYAARFAECSLTAALSAPETPLLAMADGRLLWRTLDNLLSNAAKYSMPGTRVYLKAEQQDAAVTISALNVSREPLNIDPAELTERFVRGDASRTAEGSGLGLSIAQSLMELMGGTLNLSIEGDLFRAILSLPVPQNA